MITISPLFRLLAQNQSQKELIINENFMLLDKLINSVVKSRKLSFPPENNVDFNYLYIVAQDAKGDWSGQENKIAYYQGAWHFIEPRIGMFFFIKEEKNFFSYNGNTWEKLT